MKLHEQMSDAVADVHPDTERLTGAARAIGGRTRRRRRIGAIGAVAAAGVLAAGIAVAASNGGPAPSPPVATDPSNGPGPSTGTEIQTVPIDGRAAAAALRAAVLDVVDGETTAYAGQGGHGTPINETYAEFELTPATGGGGRGVVGVNVQPATILDGHHGCTQWMLDCTTRKLPGGALLRTYRDQPVPTAEGDGQRVVAEFISVPHDLRVVASSTNGFDLPANEWDVTRPDPVLSIDQLSDVVTEDWWGFDLPARFAEEGAELAPYEELQVSLYATPTEPPDEQ